MLCIVGIHSTENLLGKEQRIIDSEDLSHYSEGFDKNSVNGQKI